MPVPAPYDRGRYNRALIVNALLDPFNVVLLAVVLIAGILLGVFAFTLPVAAVLYLAGAARTYFDEDAANKVLERERTEHRKRLAAGRVVLKAQDFAPPIRSLIEQAHAREAVSYTHLTLPTTPYV